MTRIGVAELSGKISDLTSSEKVKLEINNLPLSALSRSHHQLHLVALVLEREVFGARYAQPEMFDIALGCWKSKEPASIQTHQQLGAFRVGTLRDHGIETLVRLVVHIL